jgi:hypothetical protein
VQFITENFRFMNKKNECQGSHREIRAGVGGGVKEV